VNMGDSGDYSYPELASKIATEWNNNGLHRSASDPRLDEAVLHIENSAPFADLAAIMDALYATKRTVGIGGVTSSTPAFNVAFAVN